MASASSTSARSLFIESKMRLADRVQVNVNNIASLARQIQRGSRSSFNACSKKLRTAGAWDRNDRIQSKEACSYSYSFRIPNGFN
ncbi:uncharacterized protein LOC105183267 isoform X2 [Harpegnathos saltator]|uniref:uncharacterized protein LOC105183267 isoform X2 n=1 Tax=Harpegnathos saltator TaxID=610380 RepID=UPI00058FD7D0|nr:uncharacterized protein LOC105183267 isoform X2 [Harpegnathos saltator]